MTTITLIYWRKKSGSLIIELSIAIIATLFATWLIWLASYRLERSAQKLSEHYGMPEVVKGSVIMAVSSSFPELSTIILAGAVHSQFELGLATILGSAIFNILVIPGASALVHKNAFRTNQVIVFRETQFYLISILVTCLMICLAVIYFPHQITPLTGYLSWQLAIVPLLFYALYSFIQWYEVNGNHADPEKALTPKVVWQHWLTLLVSMIAIAVAVEILLRVVIKAGAWLSIPSYVWGATVIAVVTSLPDLFMSIKAAQNDSSDSSLGNAIGSNIFDLLVIIPCGVLSAGTVLVHLPALLPLAGFLLMSTLLVVVFMRQDYQLSPSNAWVMLGLYLAFTLWIFVR